MTHRHFVVLGSRRIALSAGVAVVLGVATASGAPPEKGAVAPAAAPAESLGDVLTGRAKDDYTSGKILFQNDDYAGALVKFERAFQESGDVRLLWNMAACEKNLRHYAAVLRLLDRYRDGDPHMSDAQRQEVNEVLQTVRALVSTIHVVVNEPGATISVDGRAVGTSPLAEPVVVDLGKRTIAVTKPGFKSQSVVQEFSGASETTFSLVLVPEPKMSQLSVFAEGGLIRVDGEVVGENHFRGSVAPGEHVLKVTADGKRPYTKDVTLAAGESRELRVALESESGGASALLWVGAGVLVAGLGVGGYFLFRPAPTPQPADSGNLGQATLPLHFR